MIFFWLLSGTEQMVYITEYIQVELEDWEVLHL